MPAGKKYGGRKKGTLNKKTEVAIGRAERILRIIEAKYFEKDIAKLSAAQRMDLYSSMLEYVSPKLSRQEIKGQLTNKISLEIVRRSTSAKHTASPATESD